LDSPRIIRKEKRSSSFGLRIEIASVWIENVGMMNPKYGEFSSMSLQFVGLVWSFSLS
jgi:hypothetical protein